MFTSSIILSIFVVGVSVGDSSFAGVGVFTSGVWVAVFAGAVFPAL